jgi:hypothetical protein
MEGTSGGAVQNRSDVKSFALYARPLNIRAIETIVSAALNFVRFACCLGDDYRPTRYRESLQNTS